MSTYANLRYFEFSLYNATEEPSFSQDQVVRLLDHLPNSIRECCIYTSLNFENIKSFITPALSSKFEYLELGCNHVFQNMGL